MSRRGDRWPAVSALRSLFGLNGVADATWAIQADVQRIADAQGRNTAAIAGIAEQVSQLRTKIGRLEGATVTDSRPNPNETAEAAQHIYQLYRGYSDADVDLLLRYSARDGTGQGEAGFIVDCIGTKTRIGYVRGLEHLSGVVKGVADPERRVACGNHRMGRTTQECRPCERQLHSHGIGRWLGAVGRSWRPSGAEAWHQQRKTLRSGGRPSALQTPGRALL